MISIGGNPLEIPNHHHPSPLSDYREREQEENRNNRALKPSLLAGGVPLYKITATTDIQAV
jgi:hypothetical protein